MPETLLAEIRSVFAAGCCNDTETKAAIQETYHACHYLCDTHTGVAVRVYNGYRAATGDETPAVIVSTASPYKFSKAVLGALTDGAFAAENEFDMVSELEALTGMPAPAPLKGLKGKAPRFTAVCEKEDMEAQVYRLLGLV